MTKSALAFLLAGAALIFNLAPARAADALTFQLDWLPGGDKAPIYVCLHQGFCEEAGVDVTIAGGRGSTEAITRLAAGASDIGISDIGALMAARVNEDVPVTAVMSIFNKGPHAFYTLEGSGIQGVADVEGKRVATSPFTSSNVYLPLVLEDAGLAPDSVSLTNADPGALGPMLVSGSTDVIIAWMTDLTRYGNQAREAGRELVALPWSAAGLELYSASLIASDRFLEERPDVARRFIEAFRHSVEFARENPREAAASVAALVPELQAEDVEGSLNDALALVFNEVTQDHALGTFDPARLAETWQRVSAAQGLEAGALDPEEIVARDFVPQG
ncbi:ABC transporter substrate-binding protein [Aureimonas populi]|uniref:ABC transporter substrate-binding protein n=1 Tax=Aureimonas populi TaxID=1701758 RepID=A0ABW5CMD4_9HYPH|nr:ABC transporter substrate-binding protein [Aureimonas populi]